MIEGVKNMAELTRDIVKGCNIVKKEDQTDEKYLFTKETGGKYRLKEDYDKIAEENIFGDKEFNLKDELKGVQKIDFNKVKFIYENAFAIARFRTLEYPSRIFSIVTPLSNIPGDVTSSLSSYNATCTFPGSR